MSFKQAIRPKSGQPWDLILVFITERMNVVPARKISLKWNLPQMKPEQGFSYPAQVLSITALHAS